MTQRGRLILVVDDDPDIASFVGLIMRRCGFSVEIAHDAEQGLERARALRPDLVITNVTMPRVDGFTLTAWIRSDPDLGSTPLLMLTAKSLPKDKLRGLVAGADDFVVKPFEPQELVLRVTALVERVHRPGYARPLEGNTSASVDDAIRYLEALRPEVALG